MEKLSFAIFVLAYLLSGFVTAQSNLDSLIAELPKQNTREGEVNLLLAISEKIQVSDMEKAEGYLLQAKELLGEDTQSEHAVKVDFAIGQFLFKKEMIDSAMTLYLLSYPKAEQLKAYKLQVNLAEKIGYSYGIQHKFQKSLNYYRKAQPLYDNFEEPLRTRKLFLNHYNQTRALQSLNKYEVAIEHLNIALDQAEKLKDTVFLSATYNTQAYLHGQLDHKEEQLNNLHKAFELYQSLPESVHSISNILSFVYFYMQLDSLNLAAKYGLEGYKNPQTKKYTTHYVTLGSYLARIYIKKNNLAEGSRYLSEVDAFIKNNELGFMYEYSRSLSLLERKKGNYVLALNALNAVWEDAERRGYIQLKQDLLSDYAALYEDMGDYKNATKYYKLHYTTKDSVQTNNSTKALGRVEARLTNIENKNQVALLEKEKVIQESQILKTRMLAAGIGALGLLGFAFLYNARRKNRIISQQKTKLETLNVTKDRIFSIIGHDLRKPAMAFKGIGEKVNFLLKKGDYKRLEALGETIEQDAHSLNKLTDNLLSWALTQKDVMPYNPQALSVVELTEETQAVFHRRVTDKGISLQSNIPRELKVFADRNTILTILRNLVDNAIKYTSAGGTVRILAEQEDKTIKIFIHDTGVGMNSDKQATLFQLQKNKSEDGTAGEKGTGLGMHLVHELVVLNKGKVSVSSQMGEGTRFALELPRVESGN